MTTMNDSQTVPAEYGIESTAALREIPMCLDLCDEQLRSLYAALEILTQKLDPVLEPETPWDAPDRPSSKSVVGDRLTTIGYQTADVTTRIERLVGRIEL